MISIKHLTISGVYNVGTGFCTYFSFCCYLSSKLKTNFKKQVVASRPSDYYFHSVCLSVCLCRVFLSRLSSDFDQTRTYVICLGLVVPLEYRGCATSGGWVTPKKLVFLGVLGLKKLSRPTVLIALS